MLSAVEINSSFYRPHRVETYQRWAATTPPRFRFSVKLPRAITHDARLRNVREPLERFLAEAGGLGPKLAVVLVQLPPSLAFDARTAGGFFGRLRASFDGAVVCEPRHASWFTPSADQRLAEWHVCRAAADPAPHPAASTPGGWSGSGIAAPGAVRYYRWHGSPRMYWSRYDQAWLREPCGRHRIGGRTGRRLVHLRQHGRGRRHGQRTRAARARWTRAGAG